MNTSIQPEHRRREREQAERQLIEQVKADYISVPGRDGRPLLTGAEIQEVRLADTRLPDYQSLLAESDVLVLLGRANNNLVALTLDWHTPASIPTRLHPHLPRTLTLRFQYHQTLLFRLDRLAVPEAVVLPGVTLRSCGTEPLVFRDRYANPLWAVTGSLPLRLPVTEIAWEAAFGSRAATFRLMSRFWADDESDPARMSTPSQAASGFTSHPLSTPLGN